MIFVTVGTQIPFDRLLKSVEKQIELGNIKEKVIGIKDDYLITLEGNKINLSDIYNIK